jgi:hypothetical protein
VLIENSRKMQKSVKTDISVAITPTPVIRFQASCLNLTSLAHLPPFFRNDKINPIYKRNIRMSGEYIFEESAWAF